MIDPLYELHALAEEAGVQTAYIDIAGRLRVASPEALLAVLRALGVGIERIADAAEARRALRARSGLDAVAVAWDGRPQKPIRLPTGANVRRVRLILESGDERSPRFRVTPARTAGLLHLDDRIPHGVHTLHIEGTGVHVITLLSAPSQAPGGPPGWGLFVPLHAVGEGATDVASFGDLAEAARCLAERGARWVATLPLLASFLDAPFEPSPYAPASRLFWNELFVPVDRHDDGARARYLDYASLASAHRAPLQAAADAFFDADGENDSRYRAFLGARPDAVDYARFRAACDRFRTGFDQWPAGPRSGRIAAQDVDPGDVRRHLYAAFRAECEIARLGRAGRGDASAALLLDLPLGVHPQGYDVWRYGSLFARGVTAGAPPDELFRGGQDWGFRPLQPDALRRAGYAHLQDVLRHHMRHAGALRIDHVMSLVRLFWIPDGFPATEGVYVRQRRDELLALILLEAAKHGTRLIGEDLGTVPAEARRAMRAHGLLGMFVLQFAFGAPDLPRVPGPVMASLNTHDTPTFAGFWKGADLADQLDLGLIDRAREERAQRRRAALCTRLARRLGTGDDPGSVLEELLARLARSSAEIVMVSLEDLWLETDPQNVPGTADERPNWRRRARFGIREALQRPEVERTLRRIQQLRERGGRE